MEHAHALVRPYPWRVLALTLSVLALGAGSVVALVDRPAASRQEPGSSRALQAPALPPLRPRFRTSVLVLNGNGTSGIAGATANRLLGRGYHSATATNATNDAYATTLVLYRPGWEREAHRLAKDAGVKVVAPLDGRLPAGSAPGQLVLILGAK
ncbi:MAG TPA: LytR C-terminal domain-containing protein [Gaiellaceae bacterium]|nr:LytR C-terminal domain-containing protein [Gaiellaceae bacterium]